MKYSDKKVLLIDDSNVVIIKLQKIFRELGFTDILTANNGKLGIERYQLEKPDVITLDVVMPIMDGVETVKVLHDLHAAHKVILVSSMGDEKLVNIFRENGVKAFLTKPFDKERVEEALKMLGI